MSCGRRVQCGHPPDAVVEVAGTGAPNPYAGKHLPHYTSGKVQSVPG